MRWVDFDPVDCTLKLDTLRDLLNEKTRLVAVTYASKSFESLAGVTAAVDCLAEIGGAAGRRRERLVTTMARIKQYEMCLSAHFLQETTKVSGLRVYGVTDIENLEQHTPTFAVSLDGYTPEAVAARLGEQGVFVWHGHYYAVAVMERLGRLDKGGLVRIGFVHYNTLAEVDRALVALADLAGKRQRDA